MGHRKWDLSLFDRRGLRFKPSKPRAKFLDFILCPSKRVLRVFQLTLYSSQILIRVLLEFSGTDSDAY
jgi:hypothetical protein